MKLNRRCLAQCRREAKAVAVEKKSIAAVMEGLDVLQRHTGLQRIQHD